MAVAGAAREILDDLREEINKSLEVEYGHEEHASIRAVLHSSHCGIVRRFSAAR
jgi:hypothetical protein